MAPPAGTQTGTRNRSKTADNAIPDARSCPKCHAGVASPVTADENGATFECAHCGFGFSVPATEDGAGLHPGQISKTSSREELEDIARQYGVHADERESKETIFKALQDAGVIA